VVGKRIDDTGPRHVLRISKPCRCNLRSRRFIEARANSEIKCSSSTAKTIALPTLCASVSVVPTSSIKTCSNERSLYKEHGMRNCLRARFGSGNGDRNALFRESGVKS
jgi:hypothetical protein